MWRRRKSQLQPVVLPSLDRLSGLIERVVELVEAVGETQAVPAPAPVPEAPADAPVEAPVAAVSDLGWLAFVASPHGYRLADVPGRLPAVGDAVELEGASYRVLKVGPSPLPGDRRRCAYLAGEEPPEAGRTSDA